jgi:hypothetical protein
LIIGTSRKAKPPGQRSDRDQPMTDDKKLTQADVLETLDSAAIRNLS